MTEAVFIGKKPDSETFASARQALFEELEPIEDHLYSADYKRHVVSVILRRTMERAYARALPRTGGFSP
jgi:CO/xanthine dehydrogenase FAD-binding subunit